MGRVQSPHGSGSRHDGLQATGGEPLGVHFLAANRIGHPRKEGGEKGGAHDIRAAEVADPSGAASLQVPNLHHLLRENETTASRLEPSPMAPFHLGEEPEEGVLTVVWDRASCEAGERAGERADLLGGSEEDIYAILSAEAYRRRVRCRSVLWPGPGLFDQSVRSWLLSMVQPAYRRLDEEGKYPFDNGRSIDVAQELQIAMTPDLDPACSPNSQGRAEAEDLKPLLGPGGQPRQERLQDAGLAEHLVQTDHPLSPSHWGSSARREEPDDDFIGLVGLRGLDTREDMRVTVLQTPSGHAFQTSFADMPVLSLTRAAPRLFDLHAVGDDPDPVGPHRHVL